MRTISENYLVPNHTTKTIGSTTTEVIAKNNSRRYLLLVNDSNEDMYIKLGVDAVMNEGIRIPSDGGSYEMTAGEGNVWQGAIDAICSSGSKTILVAEGE
ncbi:MAG: hypothetical protein WD491_02570 [Balneolales bacterium]